MKRIFCAMLSLFIFISVVSYIRLDVHAAIEHNEGTWNTGSSGISDGYQHIEWKDNDHTQGGRIVTDTVKGVYQGTDNATFAIDAPIATIYIDESKVHKRASEAKNIVQIGEFTDYTYEGTANDGTKVQIKEWWKTNDNIPDNMKDILHIEYNKTTAQQGFATNYGYNYLMFDQEKAKELGYKGQDSNGNKIGLQIGADNEIKGDIVSYTFKGAAQFNNKTADVVITYSNLHIVLQENIGNTGSSTTYSASNPGYGTEYYKNLKKFMICSGNDVRTRANAGTYQNNQRYGIKVDARVQVFQDGGVVDGTFYFKTADIDVYRGDGYDKLWGAAENKNYSEQVQISHGYDKSAGYKIYLPGGIVDNNPTSLGGTNGNNERYRDKNNDPDPTKPGYKAVIVSNSNDPNLTDDPYYRIESQTPQLKDFQECIYSGFLSAIDNTVGAQVTVWSAGAGNASVETYLLAGNAGGMTTGVWYNLKSSTETVGSPNPEEGGTIQTTTWGNRNGTPTVLGNGEKTLGPTTLTVSGGKTITYTMTPESAKGYVLKSLTIKDGTPNYQDTGSYTIDLASATRGVKIDGNKYSLNGKEEELSYSVDIVDDPVMGEPQKYIFTFSKIQQDHAIHVVWQKKYYETYEYQLEGDPGFPLPQAVLDTLPDRADIANGKENHFFTGDPIAPASPWDKGNDVPVTYVIDNDGTYDWKYTFLRYTDTDPAGRGLYSPPYNYSEYQANGEYFSTDGGGGAQKRTAMAGNIHYIGYWSRARAFREAYTYKYYEEDMVTPVSDPIPSQVTGSKPTRNGWYGDQEKVYPATPTITTYRDNNVTYRFRGWKDPTETDTYDTANPATVNNANVEFRGIWQRITYPVYVATYEYDESGGTLPDEIKNTIPYDPRDYNNGENVDAKAPSNVRMIVGKDVWVFLGWDKQSQTIPSADVKFIGKWTKAAVYTEHYAYENYKQLPAAVQNTLPVRAGRYLDGEVVSPASPSQTTVSDGEYTWRFLGWTPTPADSKINGADVSFLGRWVREGGPVIIPDPTPDPTPDPPAPTPTPTPVSTGGGGSTPPPATPVAEDALPALQVPSTETSGGATADGGTGLTIEQGQASPLAITPVLPEGVVAGGFRRVEVNGVVQPAELYHVNGDTVTLFPALLNTLPVGTHTIRLVYDNLWTEAVATVLGATRARVSNSPPTGDGNTALIYALIGIQAASAGGAAVLLKKRRRSG